MDLAEAHLLCNKKMDKIKYENFNIGLGKGISVLELIKIFEKTNGVKVNYKFTKKRKGDSPISFADNNKFIDFYFLVRGLSSSAMWFFIFESLRYLAKYIFKKFAIGKGDSKLVAMLALWLGPMGTLFSVAIAYIFAAIYCLVGLPLNLVRFRQVIPFAPFLSLGGLIMWLLGNEFIFEKILRI